MNRYVLWKLLFLSLILSCGETEPASGDTDPIHRISLNETSYEVSVIDLLPKKFHYTIKAQGRIIPKRSVELSFNISGKIDKIWISNGSYIKKGAPIARLYNTSQKLELEEAQVRLKKSKMEFENLLAEFSDSLRRSYWPRIRENLSLQAGIEQSEISLRKARYQFDQSVLRAPFDGLIDGLSVSEGSLISPGEKIASLQDISKLKVSVEVLEFDISRIKSGTSVSIFPLFDPGRKSVGKVTEIDPRVKKDGYVTVIVELSYDESLIAGMSVNVQFDVPVDESLIVPSTAVVQKSGKPVVFTAEDNKAKWNYVTLGKENGKEVQIVDGLEKGQQVIVSNNLQLAHDTPIEVKTLNTQTN